MKFLCPQCKAKYQIADEKVEGRTLRMQCRKCEGVIVIRNGGVSLGGSGLSEAPAAPEAGGAAAKAAATRPISQIPAPTRAPVKAPSSLNADFKRSLNAPDPAANRPPAALDIWHVSINDVPVGPIRRDELAKKISSGAVTGESLAWREGYDDWRPIKDIVELSPLLRRSIPPMAPAPTAGGPKPALPKPLAPGKPAPVAPKMGTAGRAAPAVVAPAARPAPSALPASAPAAAAARSNVVPIGGRLGGSAAPALDELPGFDEEEATRVGSSNNFDMVPVPAAAPIAAASVAPAAAVVAPSSPRPAPAVAPFDHGSRPPPSRIESIVPAKFRSEKRGVNLTIAFALVAGGLFIAALSAVLAVKFFAPPPQTQIVERVVQGEERIVYRDRVVEVPAAGAAAIAAAEQETKRAASTTKRTTTAEPTKVASGAANSGSSIDFSQYADNGGGGGLPNIARPRGATDDDAPGTGGGELSADSVRATLNRGRGQVQQCYENSARQTGSSDTMRVDVNIVVGSGGRPSRVTATGSVAALNRCVEGVVRRWVFAGTGEANFPLVFQPGG
jgi:predicted Zn finger-like uncharacterized protein